MIKDDANDRALVLRLESAVSEVVRNYRRETGKRVLGILVVSDDNTTDVPDGPFVHAKAVTSDE